jgi:ankyrin repeat protein
VDAIERGDLKRIDFLIAAGARLEPPQGTADLFTRAVAASHPELVEALLERGADPRTPPTQALWPLIDSGNTPVARLLLARGADPDARKDRDSLLSRALFRRRLEIVDALLDAGARANLRDDTGCPKTYNDCLPIIVARAAANDPALLKKLVARGLDLNTAAGDGHTALTATILERPMTIRAVAAPGVAVGVAQNAATGQARIVTAPSKPAAAEIPAVEVAPRIRALIAAGADPNRRIGAVTPLMLAVDMPELPQSTALAVAESGGGIQFDATIPAPRENDPPAFVLPRAGSAVTIEQVAMLSNMQGIHTGMNVGPLSWAVLHGRPDIARLLLERDRRVSPADRNLLYFAAMTGAWDVVVAAAPLSREVNAANRAGVTPLMLAANAGRSDAVRALLAARAEVNARSAASWPPFFERSFAAAFAGHSPSPPPLVGGYTALRAANEQKHTEVARLLLEAGARP